MAIIERIRSICLKPNEEWPVIAGETTPAAALMKGYALPLAALGAVAGFIGLTFSGFGFASGLVAGVVQLVLTLAGLYVMGLVIDALAPKFGAEKNSAQALKVAVYSATPALVASVLLIVPLLAPLAGLAALYGLYLLYLGLPRLMKCPQEKAVIYTLAVVACAIGLAIVARVVLWTVMPRALPSGM
jgi:hypothetical protein